MKLAYYSILNSTFISKYDHLTRRIISPHRRLQIKSSRYGKLEYRIISRQNLDPPLLSSSNFNKVNNSHLETELLLIFGSRSVLYRQKRVWKI